MKMECLVNGNEAVAWGALEAGVDYFTHYPGSPVNKIAPKLFELNKRYQQKIIFNDALNEHVSTLSAQGASLSGARSLVVMKHVGMNIASDPLNYLGYTGVKGGMLIVVGTDPGANCSTGEEDPHWYIPQLNFPVFEPSNVKEIYEYTKEAFLVSEKYETPVLMFLPSRLCFNHDTISLDDSFSQKTQKNFHFEKNPSAYVNVGGQSVKNNKKLFEKISQISKGCSYSKRFFSPQAKLGIVTRGATFGHAFESITRLGLSEKVELLNTDLVYPLNQEMINSFFKGKEEIYIIEDQGGFLENQIKAQFYSQCDLPLSGKEHFPAYGEISFGQVFNFLANKFSLERLPEFQHDLLPSHIPERLGTFCEGCPHRSSFYVIDKVLKSEMGNEFGVIGGDIGCSSLPPQRADWLLCMNAGVGMSQGITQLSPKQIVISTGGDGSFFHGGLISLMSAVHNKIDLLHVVFDNEYIAMTGHQDSPSSNPKIDHQKMLEAIGVDFILTTNAFNPKDYEKKLRKLIHKKGVRVLWVKGACSKMRSSKLKRIKEAILPKIYSSKCDTCKSCYTELQCPAIIKHTTNTSGYEIALDRCQRCRVCKQICQRQAIGISIKKRNLLKALFSKGEKS